MIITFSLRLCYNVQNDMPAVSYMSSDNAVLVSIACMVTIWFIPAIGGINVKSPVEVFQRWL